MHCNGSRAADLLVLGSRCGGIQYRTYRNYRTGCALEKLERTDKLYLPHWGRRGCTAVRKNARRNAGNDRTPVLRWMALSIHVSHESGTAVPVPVRCRESENGRGEWRALLAYQY